MAEIVVRCEELYRLRLITSWHADMATSGTAYLVYDIGLLSEREASVTDRLIEALDGFKAAVGERFVDEGPKMFGRLGLGTVGELPCRYRVGKDHVDLLSMISTGVPLGAPIPKEVLAS